MSNTPRQLNPTRVPGFLLLTGLAISFSSGDLRAQVNDHPPPSFTDLRYRHVGPVGNRVSAVAGEPGDDNIYYVGAASGGVFKSEDGGHGWRPVFDDQPAMSIGALAVSPSNPNVVWVGTGESFIRSNVSIGNGVYRSDDRGESWRHVGLGLSGRIGRIAVHPQDPDVVYVAAAGHLYGPQEEGRGLFMTTDGGVTWERVLDVGPKAGAIDVVLAPDDPNTIFAATWEMQIWPWGRESGGPGSGLWLSEDAGATWRRLEGGGLPVGTIGRIGLGMTPADPDRVYALIETNSNSSYEPLTDHQGTLWRSDDRGESWTMVNGDHALAQRPLYYSRLSVSPDDADEVHFMSTLHTRSLDGGHSISMVGGGDNHDMWIDPLDPRRMIVGNDQGVRISTDRGRAWYQPLLPIAQMYHVFTDNAVPYNLYGNRQDGPSSGGPSNTLTGGAIPIGAWRSVGGCESGFAVPDTVTNAVVWSGCFEGVLGRHDLTTGLTRTVSVWPDNPEGWAARDLRYRFNWTFPIHISPHDNRTVYVGSQHVHRTRDEGQSWQLVSPDLTLNDRARQLKSGGLTYEDVSPTYFSVLFAIAESPLRPGVIWAGSNDGLIHVSRDGGASWSDLTPHIPDLAPHGTISNIEPSRHDPDKVYITVDRHQLGDTAPYVYRSDDGGESWIAITDGIPRDVFSYAHVVREDPLRPGLLYLGTENGVYASWDDGVSWRSIQGDLPRAPVHWLTIQPHFRDLVIGTYGRGFWISDDIGRLQQVDERSLAKPIHLFQPRPAYRFLPRARPNSQPNDPAAGRNPEYGAPLDFHLGDEADGPVTITIWSETDETSESGGQVRTLTAENGRAGTNRIYWDLRHDASLRPTLLTPPLEHSHVVIDEQTGSRPMPDGGVVRPLALPGRYRVRATANDGSWDEVWLDVHPDPASTANTRDMRAQLDLHLELREMSDSVAVLIDRIELARRAILDIEEELSTQAASLRTRVEEVEQSLVDLEMRFFDLRLSGGLARQDAIRFPRGLYAKISSLAQYSSGTDHPPTDQALQVRDELRERLGEARNEWRRLFTEELAELNLLVVELGLGPITTPAEGSPEG